VHSTEKALAEHGDKVDAGTKSAIETALADLKSATSGDDVAAIQAKTQTLLQASMKLGEAMYKAQQEGASSGGGDATGGTGGTTASGEEVVDADFEEIPEEERKKSA
jgi:molecular chaperone DnaK